METPIREWADAQPSPHGTRSGFAWEIVDDLRRSYTAWYAGDHEGSQRVVETLYDRYDAHEVDTLVDAISLGLIKVT